MKLNRFLKGFTNLEIANEFAARRLNKDGTQRKWRGTKVNCELRTATCQRPECGKEFTYPVLGGRGRMYCSPCGPHAKRDYCRDRMRQLRKGLGESESTADLSVPD